jgi:hypothetical protein
MIFSVTHTSKKTVNKDISPTDHTFAICLSNNEDGFRFEEGFYSEFYLTFLDDVYPYNGKQVLTNLQAQKLLHAIDVIHKLPSHVDLLICCDTGSRVSGAVTKYIKHKYKKVTITRPIDPDNINKHVFSTLAICECNGVKKTNIEYSIKNIKSFISSIHITIQKSLKRSLKQNSISFINWVREEF